MDLDPKFPPSPVPLKGTRPIDHKAIFARALRHLKPGPALQLIPVVNLQLEFSQSGKPFVGAFLHWSKTDGAELPVSGTRFLGTSGRAVVSLDPNKIEEHEYVRLTLQRSDLKLEFPQIKIENSSTLTYKTSQGITLKVAGPEARLPSIKQAGRLKKRFNIVLSGTREQLGHCLPLFRSVKCFRIKKLLVVKGKGKPTRGSSFNIKTSVLDNKLADQLEGTDLLFDFSGSPVVVKLFRDQQSGQSRIKTIITPDCSHLVSQLETLFEGLNPDSTIDFRKHGLE